MILCECTFRAKNYGLIVREYSSPICSYVKSYFDGLPLAVGVWQGGAFRNRKVLCLLQEDHEGALLPAALPRASCVSRNVLEGNNDITL